MRKLLLITIAALVIVAMMGFIGCAEVNADCSRAHIGQPFHPTSSATFIKESKVTPAGTETKYLLWPNTMGGANVQYVTCRNDTVVAIWWQD